MIMKPPASFAVRSDRLKSAQGHQEDRPTRLAHVLFVLWVTGSVAWAIFAAMFASDRGWLLKRPELAAGLVLIPPILAHLLANLVFKLSGNPRIRS